MKKNLLLILLAVLLSKSLLAQSVEYSVKALYIEKFARFTEWLNRPDGENFIIGILGESPFSGELEKMATKNKIKGKSLKIKYLKNINEMDGCDMLFICSSEKKNITYILKLIENHSILAISDTPGFCKKGLHLNFYIDETETIKYEVNPIALKKSNLSIEMQLLKFGKIVN